MCRFCSPILGEDTLPHKEIECPLKSSAYCAYCLSYGHFQSDCNKKMINKTLVTIPAMPPEQPKNILYLTDTIPVQRAYLSTHGHVIYGKESRNKATCLSIAKDIGYEDIKWLHGKTSIKKKTLKG